MMRPRGSPPTPSARSSDSAPVGTAATLTAAASSPIFMIEPAPNCRSIWVRALCSAESRAFAAFSCSLSMRAISFGSERWNLEADPDGCSPPRRRKPAQTLDGWVDRRETGYLREMASPRDLLMLGPRLTAQLV